MREFFKNILLVFLSFAIFFIVIEIGFKILHIFSDPEVSQTSIDGVPYENTPNGWFLRYEPSNGWVFYKNNSLGMRDVERIITKSPGVKRIVCLGDSIMFGGEVPFNQIFSRQLEQFLNADYDSKIEVLNCGTTSYSLKEYLIYLQKKAINFDPDLLIVGLCLNDNKGLFETSDIKKAAFKNKHTRKSFYKVKRFLCHSYFLEYINKSLVRLIGDMQNRHKNDIRDRLNAEDWVSTKKYFVQLKDICDKKNINMIVVIFPVSFQLKNNIDIKEEQPQKFIRSMLKQTNISYVDLLEVYSSASDKGGIVFSRFDYMHPLGLGHKLAAEQVRKKIIDSNLLKINDKKHLK